MQNWYLHAPILNPSTIYIFFFFFTYSFLLFRQVIHWNKSMKHLERKISQQSSSIYVGITYYNLQPIHFTCFILFYWYVTDVPSRFQTHGLTFQLIIIGEGSANWAIAHWHIPSSLPRTCQILAYNTSWILIQLQPTLLANYHPARGFRQQFCFLNYTIFEGDH